MGCRISRPGDIWYHLETFLIVMTWAGTAGMERVETRDSTKHSKVHATAPGNKEFSSPKCQVGLRSRNPVLGWSNG